jgi:hypothetical protein
MFAYKLIIMSNFICFHVRCIICLSVFQFSILICRNLRVLEFCSSVFLCQSVSSLECW